MDPSNNPNQPSQQGYNFFNPANNQPPQQQLPQQSYPNNQSPHGFSNSQHLNQQFNPQFTNQSQQHFQNVPPPTSNTGQPNVQFQPQQSEKPPSPNSFYKSNTQSNPTPPLSNQSAQPNGFNQPPIPSSTTTGIPNTNQPPPPVGSNSYSPYTTNQKENSTTPTPVSYQQQSYNPAGYTDFESGTPSTQNHPPQQSYNPTTNFQQQPPNQPYNQNTQSYPPFGNNMNNPPPPPTSNEVQNAQSQFNQMSLGSTSNQSVSSSNVASSSSYPRPNGSTIVSDIAQPNVAPLFERRNTNIKADMSCAQADSRFIRMTAQCVPSSNSLLNKWVLPFGALIQPFADLPNGEKVPQVNLGANIIRCYNCKAYVNPFVTFIDGGRRWICNLCKTQNDVPKGYYSPLDQFGQRSDIQQRSELTHGAVDFVASKEYMSRTPQPPTFLFLIDASSAAVSSGMLKVACDSILECLDELEQNPRTKIGIITFDSAIHFYNLDSLLSEPKMLVVGDLTESILPIPSDLLVNLSDSKHLVKTLLKKLSTKIFANTTNVESALGSALNTAGRILSRLGGKLVTFLSNLPTIGSISLKNREVFATTPSNYQKLFTPADNSYKELALLFSRDQISVDLFVTTEQYVDISTLSCLPRYTGGGLYHYKAFKRETDGERLRQDIVRLLSRDVAFESVMRVRVSGGLKVSNYYGHFFIRAHELLALPNIDSDKAVGVELSHDVSYISTSNACIQSAVLYTSKTGTRMIRVQTLTLPITNTLSDMYKHSDIDATMNLMAKISADNVPRVGLGPTRDRIKSVIVNALKYYKSEVSNTTDNGGKKLVLPDSLRLLPLYGLGLLKLDAFVASSSVRIDERVAALRRLTTCSVLSSINMMYPSMYLVQPNDKIKGIPDQIVPLSQKFLNHDSVYVLCDSLSLYVWIGKDVATNEDTLNDILSTIQNLNREYYHNKNTDDDVEDDENDIENYEPSTILSLNLKRLAEVLRNRSGYLQVKLATDQVLRDFHEYKLIEDKNNNSNEQPSYEDFLRFIHQSLGN